MSSEIVPAPLARVALVGAGTIAGHYFEGLKATPGFAVVSVCSHSQTTAEVFAAKHGLSASTFDAILEDPAINYVLNLTPAHAHHSITSACLEAGKSVYSEKPLAASLAQADALIALAERRGLLLACAPATFMWPPIATAQRLVREGRLGKIAGAISTLVYPGPELFHPRPAHLYSAAAGPLWDMGVYQITSLMALLGPVVRVSAMSSRARSDRVVQIGPDAGLRFPVNSDTHIHAQLLHQDGAISSVIVSFDGLSAAEPRLDLFGQQGGLSIRNAHRPDAHMTFAAGGAEEDMPLDGPSWSPEQRAIGPTSAWNAYASNRPVTANAYRARNVLEVLLAIEEAADADMVMNIGRHF